MPTSLGTSTPTKTPSDSDLNSIPTACSPDPIIIPTLPNRVPGYAQLDPTTNLHVTGSYQIIDISAYRLEVTGLVDRPLQLSYDELRCLPRIEKSLTLVCPGFFEDEAAWAGASLASLLELAGVHEEAREVELTGADDYVIRVDLVLARQAHNFLAYEWEGQPLPILHGFPLRAVFPDQPGSRWVKWLVKMEIK